MTPLSQLQEDMALEPCQVLIQPIIQNMHQMRLPLDLALLTQTISQGPCLDQETQQKNSQQSVSLTLKSW